MPAAFASAGEVKWRSSAVEDDAPGARRHPAGDDLDQRRLAGAVVAEQRHHLAAPHLEADAAQRLDRPEMFRDSVELEQRRPGAARRFGHGLCPTLNPLGMEGD